MTRRVVIRDVDGSYGIVGLIDNDQQPMTALDDGQGTLFKLVAVKDRYLLYAPDVVEMPAEVETPEVLDALPAAWQPFVTHGVAPWPAQP